MRSSSRASARSAERPSSGEVPACAGTPWAVTVTQQPALRAVTIAPDAPAAFEAERGVGAVHRLERVRRDVAALLVGHAVQLDGAHRRCARAARARPGRPARRPSCRRRRARARARPRRAPGARRRCPAGRRCRDGRAAGSAGRPRRACARRRAGRPARAGGRPRSRPPRPTRAISVAQASSPSRWPVGESIAHSRRRRST